jgi:hypothetical protein
MPTSSATTATMLSPKPVDLALFHTHFNAQKVSWTQHRRGWLYRLEFGTPMCYDRVELAMERVCKEDATVRFIPLIDDDGQTEGKISMGDEVVATRKRKAHDAGIVRKPLVFATLPKQQSTHSRQEIKKVLDARAIQKVMDKTQRLFNQQIAKTTQQIAKTTQQIAKTDHQLCAHVPTQNPSFVDVMKSSLPNTDTSLQNPSASPPQNPIDSSHSTSSLTADTTISATTAHCTMISALRATIAAKDQTIRAQAMLIESLMRK